MSESKKTETTITAFACGDCGGEEWHLNIVHHEDGRTLLSVCCSDTKCVAAKKQLLGCEEDDIICCDELDITGQGYDPDDIEYKGDVLPHLGAN